MLGGASFRAGLWRALLALQAGCGVKRLPTSYGTWRQSRKP